MTKKKQRGFIDIDDVSDGVIFGGFVIGLILLLIYVLSSKPKIDECEKKGGIPVKSNGEMICVDKKALIGTKP